MTENVFNPYGHLNELGSTTIAHPPPFLLDVQVRFCDVSFEGLPDAFVTHIKDTYGQAMTSGSAGIDLRYVGKDTLTLYPGEQCSVGTGLAIYLKDPRWVGLIYPRSGLGSTGLVLGNLTGVIDADYQGELFLCLWNRKAPSKGVLNNPIVIEPGERVAQYLAIERQRLRFNVVEQFDTTTQRHTGGFGSTGKY